MDFAEEYSYSDSTRGGNFFHVILCVLALGMIVFMLYAWSHGGLAENKSKEHQEPTHSYITEEQ